MSMDSGYNSARLYNNSPNNHSTINHSTNHTTANNYSMRTE